MVHNDELDISEEAVHELIWSQFPKSVQQPIRYIQSSGPVDVIFRIGADLVARFPLQAADPGGVSMALSIPGPSPSRHREPRGGLPAAGVGANLVAGTVATDRDPSGSAQFARDLATLVAALRKVDTSSRQVQRAGRGGDLRDHDTWVDTCLRQSARFLDVSRPAKRWHYFLDLPRT